MKARLLILAAVMLSFLLDPRHAASDDAEVSLLNYFTCLQTGDTQGILDLLTAQYLRQRRQLLETNETYSAFLKRAYRGATLRIREESGFYADRRIVNVKISFGERGPPMSPRFVLLKVNGAWKIANEVG